MSDLPGYEFAFTQPIEMRTSEMLTGARGDLAIKVFGPDLEVLADLAGQIQAALSRITGTAEVSTVANDRVDYLQVAVDRLAVGRTGLDTARVQDELRAMVEGAMPGSYRSRDDGRKSSFAETKPCVLTGGLRTHAACRRRWWTCAGYRCCQD